MPNVRCHATYDVQHELPCNDNLTRCSPGRRAAPVMTSTRKAHEHKVAAHMRMHVRTLCAS